MWSCLSVKKRNIPSFSHCLYCKVHFVPPSHDEALAGEGSERAEKLQLFLPTPVSIPGIPAFASE